MKLDTDAEYFLDLQTKTGWGQTLLRFAEWCAPQPGWNSLDVGCGPGLLPAIFAQMGCFAVGVDMDQKMFMPKPIHSLVVVGDLFDLPFKLHSWDLITLVNVLFLLNEPQETLQILSKLLKPGGKLAMLNPSGLLDEQAARNFANKRGLSGLARESLINWAKRATIHHRWSESETNGLYRQAGMKCMESVLKIGPGFARFSWGTS